jgi:hypothetical protein
VKHNHCALLATVEVVAGCVSSMADDGKKYAPIERHCALISKAHTLHGYSSPIDEAAVMVGSQWYQSDTYVWKKQVPTFTIETFKNWVQAIDDSTTAGTREKLIPLLGFAYGFWRC